MSAHIKAAAKTTNSTKAVIGMINPSNMLVLSTLRIRKDSAPAKAAFEEDQWFIGSGRPFRRHVVRGPTGRYFLNMFGNSRFA